MLRGATCYLRKLEAGDLHRTLAWVNRPDIASAIGLKTPITEADQADWFEQTNCARDKIVFAICLDGTDRHVGNASLGPIDESHRHARLSIFIADLTDRGKGIGSGAIDHMLGYAFDVLKLHRVYLKTDAESDALARFYRRLGFAPEGRLREHERLDGKFVDKALFGILESEWRARQDRRER
jgi:RimJ/RimL family protein N-acetyltransferase